MSQEKEILVPEDREGIRLDLFLTRKMGGRYSRSKLKKAIEEKQVLVNGKPSSAHYLVRASDKILFRLPEDRPSDASPEDIPLEIIHEDRELILVNKPAGMVVHPAQGNQEHTLVNALLHHANKLSKLGGMTRPGIVHRLDKDTSGIMVVAKNDTAHAFLADQFRDKTIERVYRVIVRGVVQHEEGVCEEPVGRAFLNRKKIVIKPSGGKEAETYYKVLERFKTDTLLEVRPQTGRTHQIRVHMDHIGHPVIGDAFYGVTSPWINRQCVHAFGLGFIHPKTKEWRYYECPIPGDMQALLFRLRESILK